MGTASGLGIVAGALLAVCSCSDAAPFVGQVASSQLWEYHDEVAEPLCPTLLSVLDEHTLSTAPMIGLQLDAPRPFRYYKFAGDTAFASSSDVGGQAVGDYVFSPRYFAAHEQAHVYVFRAWGGWSADFLNEGEAVALSCDPTVEPGPDTTPRELLRPADWRVQLYDSLYTPEGYAAAGFLIMHLARQYGWGQVAQLHRRAVAGAAPADFERVFAQIFPVSIDRAWSDALDMPGASACEKHWTCRSTPLNVGDHARPECDGQLHRSVTVAPGDAGIVLDVADDRGITLSQRCTDPALPWYPLPGTASGTPATHWALVPPGSYALFAGASDAYVPPGKPVRVTDGEFTPTALAPAEFALRAAVPAGLASETCAIGAAAVALNGDAKTYVDVVRAYDDVWIRLDGGGRSFGATAVNLFAFGAADPVTICNGCGAAAVCTPLPVASITLDGGSFLHLQGSVVDRPPAAGQIVLYPTPAAATGP